MNKEAFMKIKSLPILAIAGLLGGALSGSALLYAQEGAAGQEMHESGAAAQSATEEAGSSAKHAYRATIDEVSDAALTTKVKTALLSDQMTRKFTIHVESDQGAVMLRGNVDSPETAAHAETVVANVSGVESVKSQLTWPTSSAR
jgi:hyperosmotically inducible periplasmic protein